MAIRLLLMMTMGPDAAEAAGDARLNWVGAMLGVVVALVMLLGSFAALIAWGVRLAGQVKAARASAGDAKKTAETAEKDATVAAAAISALGAELRATHAADTVSFNARLAAAVQSQGALEKSFVEFAAAERENRHDLEKKVIEELGALRAEFAQLHGDIKRVLERDDRRSGCKEGN